MLTLLYSNHSTINKVKWYFRPDAGARAVLYRAIFGYYWPIFKWLLVVTDSEIKNFPWCWWLLYQGLSWGAFLLLFFQVVRLVWMLISTLLMAVSQRRRPAMSRTPHKKCFYAAHCDWGPKV